MAEGRDGFVQPRDGRGRFLNLDGSGPHGVGEILRWGLLDRLTGRRRRAPARAVVPVVPADPARVARPPAPGEGARLTWLGHASWLVQLDGRSFVIDGVLSDRIAGFLGRNAPPGLALDQLPPIDAALVSHVHWDHLDLATLRGMRAPVYVGLGVGRLLRREPLRSHELRWWDTVDVGGVRVTFVPSQHWSKRGLGDTNRTLWGGFVLEGSSAAVYHAGDTGWFGGFAEIGRRHRLDAALLPIGAYDPAWFMSPQHMNPEEALRAFGDLGARTFLAMHWGTFKLTDEPLDEPPRRLEAERARLGLAPDRVRVPAIGETVDIRR